MQKIAVCTTFPESYWDLCAAEMVSSFNQFWGKDIPLLIQLDNLPKERYDTLQSKIMQVTNNSESVLISNVFEKPQLDFLERHKNDAPTDNYRFQCTRFSYKVFALFKSAVHAKKAGFDYLVWLDADVITKKQVTEADLKEWLPQNEQVVSYLGRLSAPHSECGFIAFNLNDEGMKLLAKMQASYETDAVLQLQGWTDCDVFDVLTQDLPKKNLTEGVPGWHVFPLSPLGKHLEHRKGARKVQTKQIQKQQPVAQPKHVSLDNMQINTKNCIENDKIKSQVKENIGLILKWVELCKKTDEEIVIASAGENLNPEDLWEWQRKGVKIVAVKHAVERLLKWGIKPWACILLDPREHVEKFVSEPNKDILYIVSSMVHPSVTRSLLKSKCRVVGYHAFVNAGEHESMRPNDVFVSGGSATATRGISLLADCFGFSKFHLYGYDLCHYDRPDFNAMNDDGQPKFYEVSMTEKTYGNEMVKKTFWTEGQFLAQAKELADLYKNRKDLTLNIYGDGIAGWTYRHYRLYNVWADKFINDMNLKRERALDANDWVKYNT